MTNVRVLCVLRSGGDYTPAHVIRLQRQLAQHAPGVDLACLSDIDIEGVTTIPLIFDWPGWWAKMEMFRPDIRGPIFYLDLDVSLVGPIDGFLALDGAHIMRDVYRPAGLQSAAMYLDDATRAEVWRRWISDPAAWMRRHKRGGDQAFLETVLIDRVERIQDAMPGGLVSYKADVAKHGLGDDARVVMFHGRPRPWEVPGW